MECHRINGKIWVIQISYFIQIQDHQSTIGNTSCPWKVLDPSKLATVLGSLPIWPFETRLTIWLLPSHIHLPAPPWAADLFSPKRWSPVGEVETTQQMAGAQEAILGQSSAHSFATGPWESIFFGSPNQKMGGFLLGWQSKWVKVQVEWLKTSKVKSYQQMRQLLHVTCFILLLASSRLKRSRGQEMKTLPLKSYKYVHESWSSIWKNWQALRKTKIR